MRSRPSQPNRALFGALAALLLLGALQTTANAQDDPWDDWGDARGTWDRDREQLPDERDKNASYRVEQGLPVTQLQSPEAGLTPPTGARPVAPLPAAAVVAAAPANDDAEQRRRTWEAREEARKQRLKQPDPEPEPAPRADPRAEAEARRREDAERKREDAEARKREEAERRAAQADQKRSAEDTERQRRAQAALQEQQGRLATLDRIRQDHLKRLAAQAKERNTVVAQRDAERAREERLQRQIQTEKNQQPDSSELDQLLNEIQ